MPGWTSTRLPSEETQWLKSLRPHGSDRPIIKNEPIYLPEVKLNKTESNKQGWLSFYGVVEDGEENGIKIKL